MSETPDELRAIIREYIAAKRNDAGLSRRDQDEAVHVAWLKMKRAIGE